MDKLPYPLLNAKIPLKSEVLAMEAMKGPEVIPGYCEQRDCGAPHCVACSGESKPLPMGIGRRKVSWPGGDNGDNDEDGIKDDKAVNFESVQNSFYARHR